MSNIYGATSLLGGGSGALDKIDGTDLLDGDSCEVVTSLGVYHYHLDATSGDTESSPYIVSPDTNAGTKRWLLVTPQGPFSHVRASANTTQSISDSTNTDILYTTEEYDLLSEFNSTTSIFTATYAGYYSVCASFIIGMASFSVGEFADIYIVKNSTAVTKFRLAAQATVGFNAVLAAAANINLAVSDTIKVQCYHEAGSSQSLLADVAFNYLTIDRIA